MFRPLPCYYSIVASSTNLMGFVCFVFCRDFLILIKIIFVRNYLIFNALCTWCEYLLKKVYQKFDKATFADVYLHHQTATNETLTRTTQVA